MKKTSILILVTLSLLFIGFSFSFNQLNRNGIFHYDKKVINSPSDTPTTSSIHVSSNDLEGKIIMKTEQDSYNLPVNEINLLITNNTLDNYETDTKYTIEFYDGTNWLEIPLEFFVGNIGINIFPKESMEFSFHLYPEQHRYVSGRYRISKIVSAGDEEYEVFALFDIE